MWSHLPKLWRNHSDAYCVAFACAGMAVWWHRLFTPSALSLLLAITWGYWFAFAVNDYWDASEDAGEPTKSARNFFVAVRPKKSTLLLAFFCLTLPIALPFLSFGGRGVGALALSLAVLWAYSAPPLRLKNRPILDLLTHASFVETYPYILILWLTNTIPNRTDYTLIALAALASLTAQLEQQHRDYEIDLQNKGTFTTWIGRKRAKFLLQTLTLLLIVLGILAFAQSWLPLPLLPLALIALPILLRRFYQKTWSPTLQHLSYWLGWGAALYMVSLLLLTLYH